MAKAGIGAAEVRNMCHAELAAWFDDILLSMGMKRPVGGDGVIISRRRPKPAD
ncbi:TetR family transcriptional regulator [Neisseria leonii]|uniref:TetR family transcriptional regulator n=1 Tax=Neisseria leonii TaxID=2995413 RepID=UPI00237C19A3|nr:TetR family transcriptional regulator [Neisseria sp. 3986]MDD9325611.1 TetR family transcriptional regulator [Neisseria sp. 3986]